MTITITHLLDDATPGGVTRVLDHLCTSKALNKNVKHQREMVQDRGRWPRFEGEVIVSHLAIKWRNLPALMALRAKHPQAKLIHVEHSYTQRFTALNVPKRDRFYTLLRTAYALFDRVVCVSRAQGSWMATRALVDDAKLRIIRSAVDLTDLAALSTPKGQPKTVGLIGRLHDQKGFDQAIAAFKLIDDPTLTLKVFGSGAEEQNLKALAGNDPRISFEGFCHYPSDAINQVDLVVMPSRWEAYGLVAQEALAAGRQVLVAPVDGLLDQIEDGAVAISGLGTQVLASDIQRILSAEPSNQIDQRAFAANSKATFETDWNRLIKEVLAQNLDAARQAA
ncbi:MAG: glycosyltransferase family 4 protein [Cognatishimia sp.]|uniref:glycosyltransferase family 4 protein n=1 Tax=Cognatishimia sp. TaxID=2211648 RepID=UPI003B8CD152